MHLGGSILVFIFFGIVAGDTGMFSAYGTINFLEVSANLGIIAIAAALLMIGGEFDLSVGSMIGFAGICIAIPAIYWGWPLWSVFYLLSPWLFLLDMQMVYLLSEQVFHPLL